MLHVTIHALVSARWRAGAGGGDATLCLDYYKALLSGTVPHSEIEG
jgi:hypothetical protein